MNAVAVSSIVNSESLPSMPAVAFKILELCRQEDVRIQDVAGVIAKDPALTAKLMKLANSSMFGMSRKIGSIQQGMVVLGLRTVKIMTLSFSLVDSLNGTEKTDFDYPRYWRRSLSTAVAAQQLACSVGNLRRDELFVGGLLCDVGMVAAERHPDRIYSAVTAEHNMCGGHVHEIEKRLLGITHAEISAMMLAQWSMPEQLAHAVRAHHGDGYDQLPETASQMAAVLWAASDIAGLFCGDIDPVDFEVIKQRAVSLTGVSATNLEAVLNVLNENVHEAAEMFSVELASGIDYEQIRAGAALQLATLSMDAEKERASAVLMANEARSQVRTLSMANQELSAKASTDKLTGVANRSAFDDLLGKMLASCRARGEDFGLIMLDLDHFKALNDKYGHLAGDEALRLVGKTLMKIHDGQCVPARYGGEEFAIIVTQLTAKELHNLAETVRKNIGRIRFKVGSREISLTASLGAVHVSCADELIDEEEMVRRSDACLYEAKSAGRNRVEIGF